MTQNNFEKNGGTYTQVGDYLIPNLTLPPENDTRPIGIWGQRHYEYLKNHRKGVYSIMLMDNTLHTHLADINEQSKDMFFRLVKDMAKAEDRIVKGEKFNVLALLLFIENRTQ